MCGIAGIFNFDNQPVAVEDINLMISKIKHRGPDDEGVWINDHLGLGFVRLSILDLSDAGHQPMFSDDARYSIIFNGEIFNFIEIRDELIKNGVGFRSKTDTEVLLKSYIFWGEECLDKFNGMWAFVIYDKETKSVFAARDRFGVKPFYYYVDNRQFIFASEIPAILEVLKEKPIENKQAIFDYLVFNRTDQNETTFYTNILKLKHGHSLTINGNKLTIRQWYNLKSNVLIGFENPSEYKKLLSDSVRLRLRSDVPIGVCLSGGLDSSSIVSILLKEFDNNVNTFSAIYSKNFKGDESEFIKEYDNELKNMYYVEPSDVTLFFDLDSFIETHAEPISSTSPYAQYKVMELAHQHVKVTLDGQGADEELGGYHYFFGIYYKELLFKLHIRKLIKEVIAYKKLHKSNFALKTFVYFLLPSFLRIIIKVKEKGFLNDEFYKENKLNSSISDTIYQSKSVKEACINHFEHKLEHLLKWEDTNSMRFSIEARTPFLDYRLVERSIALKSELLLKNGQTKYIFRESMKNILPEKIRTRQDKVGFETPEADWFIKDPFKSFIFEMLNSDLFKQRRIIDPVKAKCLYEKHLKKQIDISRDIWKWINLELWFRKYIDK